jgi:hypothetical protein
VKSLGALLCASIIYVGVLSIFGQPLFDGLNFDTSGMFWRFLAMAALYAFFFIVMCTGILFSSAFRMIKSGPAEVAKPFRIILQSYQSFLLGVLVSPIVFASLISQLDPQQNMLVSTLFSFQNGFFWESVFKKSNEANFPQRETNGKKPATTRTKRSTSGSSL